MLYLIVAPRITPITLRVGVFKGVVAAVVVMVVVVGVGVVVGVVMLTVWLHGGKGKPSRYFLSDRDFAQMKSSMVDYTHPSPRSCLSPASCLSPTISLPPQ